MRWMLLNVYMFGFIGLIFFNPVYAQRSHRSFSFGMGGTIGLPLLSENFQEYWRNGLGLGSSLKYDFTPMNSIAFCLTYLHYSVDDRKTIEEFEPLLQNIGTLGIHGGGRKYVQLGLHIVRYLLPPDMILRFYITGGSGLTIIHEQALSGSVTKSERSEYSPLRPRETFFEFGFSGGVGMEMMLKENLWFYLEGKIHHIITEGRETPQYTGPVEKALGIVDSNTTFIAIGSGLRFGL